MFEEHTIHTKTKESQFTMCIKFWNKSTAMHQILGDENI